MRCFSSAVLERPLYQGHIAMNLVPKAGLHTHPQGGGLGGASCMYNGRFHMPKIFSLVQSSVLALLEQSGPQRQQNLLKLRVLEPAS